MKTSELTGTALDWAVATAEGMSWWTRANANWDTNLGYTDWVLDKDGVLKSFYFDGSRSRAGHWEVNETFTPSTDWSQGGPIIERERIDIEHDFGSMEIVARKYMRDEYAEQWGDTPLIAAMRCYISSKLGDKVDIPTELM
jgi:hypothetical protein